MSRSGLWISWLLVGFIVLGGVIGYVLTSFWGSSISLWLSGNNQDQLRTILNEDLQKISDYKYHPPDEPVYHSAMNIKNLKNPFIVPGSNNEKRGQYLTLKRKLNFLEYQGIIETNNSIFGLVKVVNTGEVFVVYEGENLVEFEICKITPKTLTYSIDGREVVIPLGGKLH